MLGLQYFSFSDLWSPYQLLLTIAVALLYLALTGPLRSRFEDAEPVSAGKKTTFLLGLLLFYISDSGPVNLLGHLMFSAHMTAMSIAYLVAPPLMLLGIPGWLFRPLFAGPIIGKVMKALTHPLITLLTFNALFSFYHIPEIHDYVMTHYAVHRIFFYVLLLAALMMWWPVISPLPEQNRMSELKKMAYIFGNGVLITPACALIIFASTTIYSTYYDPVQWAKAMGYCVSGDTQLLLQNFEGPQFFALFSPLEDQQLGGVIMKLMQELTYGVGLAYIFFNWYSNERAKDDELEPDPVV